MAMELFGDSDVESFSDTSSDYQDDAFSIYSGQALGILSSLEDSIGKIDDFLLFEREFAHGDIVRTLGNQSGQMGRIMKVEMVVDLENVFGVVVNDVHSERLLRMGSIMVGDYVVHGPWLGRVEKVVDNVRVLFDNGAKCEIMAIDKSNLLPLSPNLLDDSLYPHHPGQRVKVIAASSISSGWLCGISKNNQNEGTVISVEVGFVYVDWVSSAVIGVRNMLPPPPHQQDPKNLTLLSCFSPANWQLGDWCILPKKSEMGWHRGCSKLDEMFSIVKKKIWVDVVWQDGCYSTGLDSQSLFPVNVINAHDFFPDQFVLEKGSSEDLVVPTVRRWGVVRSVDADEQTVKVKWMSRTGDVDREVDETVSAYELVEHPDFSNYIGDIVFRSDTSALRKECAACLSASQKEYFLSCIGNVVGFKNGDIEVQWASGVTTKVAPGKILRMEKDDGLVVTHLLQEENLTAFNNEMAEHKGQAANPKDILDPAGNASLEVPNDHQKSRFSSLSEAAVGFFSSIATNFFKACGSTSPAQPNSCTHVIHVDTIENFDVQDMLESCDMPPSNPSMLAYEVDACRAVDSKQEIRGNFEEAEFPVSAENAGLRHFRQFGAVGDCSDHHFVDGGETEMASSQMRKGWLKKVQQEWSILEKDLPETIYVRIYEERMDLIRAAIVGAPGTPYQDGLFFFDIFLPPDYPNLPPLVHYHSCGLRVNPNLYESGKVCLSLLNTWTGTGSEVWNPGSSTILQVLLSLQALVLNDKPYFNEAGYDTQKGKVEGEKNSICYNENAYLGTCKSMLYLLRKPPKHFEELIHEHFSRCSQHIMSACKAYMEGAAIGFETMAEHEKANSTGFRIMLAKLFPKLLEVFCSKGIDCSRFV